MKRYFYIGDDLKDLKLISSELEGNGFAKPQIHLITKKHDISYLDSLMPIQHDFLKILFRKENIILLCIIFSAILVSGLVFLEFKHLFIAILFIISIFILFQLVTSNNKEKDVEDFDQTKIKQQLQNGRYILLVELANTQQEALDSVIINHPNIESAGVHVYH
ncbi:hypothetical protein AADZ86_02110 [Colwelliaceae bacterium BS250]